MSPSSTGTLHSPSLRNRPATRSKLIMIRHASVLFGLGMLANIVLTIAIVIKLAGPLIDLFVGRGKSEAWSWAMGCWTADNLWNYMQIHFEDDLNAKLSLTFSGDIDKIQADEGAVVIANHQGYADYYLIHALASRCPISTSSDSRRHGFSQTKLLTHQSMLGRCRYFAKKSLVWQVPVFGWSIWAIGMILISRHWTADASLIEQAFRRIKKNHHPCWVISYLEGTRLSARKIQQSQEWARDHGKPILHKVLYPRTKGFVCTVRALRSSHVRYVYDLTLSYKAPPTKGSGATHSSEEKEPLVPTSETVSSIGRTPALDELLSVNDLAQAGYSFHVDVRRIAIEDLPNEEEGLKDWVEQAWIRKEGLLRRWHDDDVLESVEPSSTGF